MAEPTAAERARIWDLLEQIQEEIVRAEVDWPKLRRWVSELAGCLEAIASRR